ISILRAFFAAPAVASPSAAQFASLSSCTVHPNSGRNASAKQTLLIPRLVPNLSVQVALSNDPGTPMPMLVMASGAAPPSPHSVSASCFMTAHSPAASPVGVGALCLHSRVPSSPHSAALTVVPPKSIPILMIIPPFSCLRKNTQAPPAEIRVQPLHAAVDHQLFRKADLLKHLKRSFH